MNSLGSQITPPSREEVLACLDKVMDPCSAASASPMSIVEMGLIRDLQIGDDGRILVGLRLTSPSCYMVSYMATHARQYIGALAGVSHVEVEADAGLDWDPSMIAPAAAERRRAALSLYVRKPTAD